MDDQERARGDEAVCQGRRGDEEEQVGSVDT